MIPFTTLRPLLLRLCKCLHSTGSAWNNYECVGLEHNPAICSQGIWSISSIPISSILVQKVLKRILDFIIPYMCIPKWLHSNVP